METEPAPVAEIRATFVDDVVAREVAETLNRWFRWIVEGSEPPVPEVFEPFGIDTGEWAWALEDVDWSLGPHARAVGDQVRIAVQTHETYRRLAGLLRRLGALRAEVQRGT